MQRRRERGGATVELAVSMIVIIPTVLYTMFLEDLLFYKLDQAEAIVSSPWDFHNQDYRTKADKAVGWVQHANRVTYADHTSAANAYEDQEYDLKGEKHHAAMTAHQCWLPGDQVTCSIESGTGLQIDRTFNWKNGGGLAGCWAVLGVQNYFLPMDLFGKMFSKVSIGGGKLKEDKWKDDKFHDNAKQDPYLFPRQDFGIVVDPWALNKMDDDETFLATPDAHPLDQASEFASWVRIPYGLRQQMTDDAVKFIDDAVSDEILDDQMKSDGIGDDITTPPVAWKKDYDREFNDHTASGYSNSGQQQSYSAMQDNYMGQKPDSW